MRLEIVIWPSRCSGPSIHSAAVLLVGVCFLIPAEGRKEGRKEEEVPGAFPPPPHTHPQSEGMREEMVSGLMLGLSCR